MTWRNQLVKVAWRRAGYQDEEQCRFVAPKICEEAEKTPFMWGNGNWLILLRNSLDFMSKSPELRDWFTKKYNWKGNPLSMPTLPEERPTTPRRGTIFMIVYGEKIEKPHPTEMKERIKELALLREWRQKCNAVPAWWPYIPEEHQKRVRMAEKVLLKEEQWELEQIQWIKDCAAGKDVANVDKFASKKQMVAADDEESNNSSHTSEEPNSESSSS